jgi:hypothetical protein
VPGAARTHDWDRPKQLGIIPKQLTPDQGQPLRRRGLCGPSEQLTVEWRPARRRPMPHATWEHDASRSTTPPSRPGRASYGRVSRRSQSREAGAPPWSARKLHCDRRSLRFGSQKSARRRCLDNPDRKLNELFLADLIDRESPVAAKPARAVGNGIKGRRRAEGLISGDHPRRLAVL